MITRILMACFFSFAAVANAGEWQDRGGGDAVLNDGKWSLLDLVEQYDASYYFPQSQPYFASEIMNRLALTANRCAYPFSALMATQTGIMDRWWDLFFRLPIDRQDKRTTMPDERYDTYPLNTSLPLPGQSNRIVYRTLKFEPSEILWLLTDKELEEIPDEGTIRLPAEIPYKKQLGVQKNGVVFIYRPVFEKLDDRNKAAFIMHELLLFAAMHGGASHLQKHGTSDIRKLVYTLFNSDFKELPQQIFEPVCGWHGTVFADFKYKISPNHYGTPGVELEISR